jgi:hypothetical protein
MVLSLLAAAPSEGVTMPLSRRSMLLAAGAAGAIAAGPGISTTAAAASTLKWNPDPDAVGLDAFEGVEDDRANSDPGVKHIYVSDHDFRFDMPLKERDTSTDRQRNEVKGMRQNGSVLKIQQNQTWRITWQVYIPSSLTATSHFTHISQIKVPDFGSPLLTMTLHDSGGPKVELRYYDKNGNTTTHSPTNLTPLQNTWIDVAWEMKASHSGYVRWTISNAGSTVVDTTFNADMWRDLNYLRQKWGIYRSVQSSGLKTTYLLLRNLKGYQLT